MDADHVAELTSKFSSDISALKEAMAPLTKEPLSETASQLPLLDQAKLYAFAAYSIESILFSNLRITGTDAKSHPVFKELQRVQQYFNKIKEAEASVAVSGESVTTPKARRTMTVDKAAVERMIRHELASNQRIVRAPTLGATGNNTAAGMTNVPSAGTSIGTVSSTYTGTKRKFGDEDGNGTTGPDIGTAASEAAAEVAPAVAAAPSKEDVAQLVSGAAAQAMEENRTADQEEDDEAAVEDSKKKKGKAKKGKKNKKVKGT